MFLRCYEEPIKTKLNSCNTNNTSRRFLRDYEELTKTIHTKQQLTRSEPKQNAK